MKTTLCFPVREYLLIFNYDDQPQILLFIKNLNRYERHEIIMFTMVQIEYHYFRTMLHNQYID